MAFSKMKNRSENTDHDHNRNDILAFLRKNIRYIAAGVLFFLLILVLVRCGAPENNSEDVENAVSTETETEETFQVDAYEEVNALIGQYFTAYAKGDVEAIVSIASPVSDTEKSYIAEYSKFVDSYQNIKCYTKRGLDDKSYMVSVYLEIKFTDAETAAPGLDFFYVRTNEDGSLFIDNLYSQYNSRMKENALDTSVQSLIDRSLGSEDMIALQREVQAKYDKALVEDPALADVVTSKIPAAITEWKKALLAENSGTETENSEETEALETEAAEETEALETETSGETEAEAPAEADEKVYAVDVVNVRASADTSAEKLGTLEKGTAITRTGTEGEWSIVNYGGVTGYIKTEFLSTEEPQAETAADEPSAGGNLQKGTVVTLSDSVNIRASMSETSEKMGTAFPGEKVTVVMSYAEGWTKVNWNDQIGYVKSSLLQ